MNLQGFAEFIEEKRQAWKVPGVAVAIVKDGETIFSQGFGQRSVEDNLPVTDETIFAIGSASKAFTAASAAIAVDDGKLDWEKPVQDYLPEFKMYDLFATNRMTVRDLLSHRSGLPRHEFVWYGSKATREDIIHRVRYLEPNRDFRTYFQYQNLMYTTAGYLAGKLEGSSWEAVVRDRIFKPLGMSHSQFSVNDTQKGTNFALGYGEKKEVVEKLPFHNIDEMGPAGSINSNLVDMVKWVNFQLSDGKVGEQVVISEGNLRQTQSAQMSIADPLWYELMSTKIISYGMGWFIQPFQNETLLHHGGNIDGFSALVTFMPGQKAGVVVLTNLNSNALTETIAWDAYDRILGTQGKDWHSYFFNFYQKLKAQSEEAKTKSDTDRVQGTQPSHPLSAYVGEYEHPAYETIKITQSSTDPTKLVTIYHDIELATEHYHYDIFQADFSRFEILLKLTFETDSKGNISSVSIPLDAAVKPIIFTRIADASLKNRAFLEQFAGKYEVMGMTLTVALRGEDQLIASIPGQGDQTLEPYMDTTFNLKGLSGFSVKFIKDAEGAVTEAIISQPGATLSAKKVAD